MKRRCGDLSKEAYYFSHDANARQDPKILALMSVYGAEGYGWYWIIVETLREQSDFTLDMQGKYSFNALAMQMHCNKDTAEKFVHDCIDEFELFASDGQSFWSNSLLRRMAMKEEISQKRKKAAEKRWGKKQEDAESMQMHNTSNADGMQGKEKKVKESKVNKNKESNKERHKQVYDDTSSFYQLAIYFFERIKENNPDHKEPNLQQWSDEIRKIIELDKRTEEQVKYLMKWVQEDDFEKVNVLSPVKLRKRFDNLVMKIKNQKSKTKQSIFTQGEQSKQRQRAIEPLSAEELEVMKRMEEELPY